MDYKAELSPVWTSFFTTAPPTNMASSAPIAPKISLAQYFRVLQGIFAHALTKNGVMYAANLVIFCLFFKKLTNGIAGG